MRFGLFVIILLLAAVPSWSREVQIEGAILLSVELAVADVTVEGWDQEKLDIQEKKLEYRILREEERITIRSSSEGTDGTPEIKIRMPRDMILELSLGRGKVIVREVENDIKIALDQGDVLLDGTSGAYDVAVNVGDIAAKIFLDGEARFKTARGNILISVLSDDPMPMELESGEGDIVVELTQRYHAALEMLSGKDDASCDFDLAERREENGWIKGEIGDGGPYLRVSAYDGAVRIRKVTLPHTKPERYIPSYLCSLTQITPQVDGYPNDEIWWYGDFIELDGVSALFRHDGRRLYGLIVIRCDPAQVKVKAMDRDEGFEDDSRIELTFAADRREYTVLVNPLETIHDKMTYESDGKKRTDEGWSPLIEVSSGLGDDFWLVELSIPLEAISRTPLSKLGFNLRVEAGDVNAEWVEDDLGEMILSQKAPEEWMTKIERVGVEGADPLKRKEALSLIGLNEGDEVPLDRLEVIRDHLLLTEIFKDLSFVVEKQDDGVELTVKLLPDEIYRVEEVEISGITLFDRERMKRLFRTMGGIIPKERAVSEAKLIEKLYRTRGYDFAKVELDSDGRRLTVKVNEGVISRLKVEGARTTKYEDIKQAFGELPLLVKGRTDLERRLKDMERILKEKNSSFKAIKTWRLEDMADGYLLRLRIAEEREISSHISPLFDFNRVHGVMLGGKYQVSSRLYWGERIYAEIGRGFSSEEWDYNFGAEKGFFPKRRLTIGGHLYRMTDTNDRWRISPLENLLAELLFGKAYMDFFRRDGWEVYSLLEPFKWLRLRLGYSDDRYESLSKRTDWYLFYDGNKGEPRHRVYRARGGWKIPRSDAPKRENLPIDEGEMRSLWVRCYIDLRDKRRYRQHHFIEEPSPSRDIRNGWLGYIGAEIAGGRLGGDFDFSLVEFTVTKYIGFRRHRFDLRLMGAYTPDEGELPEQRRTYLGGLGSLRGYHLKEFSDDSFLMLNADYGLKLLREIWLNLFFDVGYLWYKDEARASSGFGFSIGPFRMDFAQALEDSEREMIASLRIGRVF